MMNERIVLEEVNPVFKVVGDIMGDGSKTGELYDIRVRKGLKSSADVVFYPSHGKRDQEREYRQQLINDLELSRLTDRIFVRKGSVGIRFTDECIEMLAERMSSEPVEQMTRAGGLLNKSFIVEFLDPNVSKALHVGHLRNIVIGHAYASLLEAAGARVDRQSLVCDIGRNVFEAMAGVSRCLGDELRVPVDEKPDHLVGRCYAEYVRGLAEPPDNDPAGKRGETRKESLNPIEREIRVYRDMAEDIMGRWIRSNDETADLWHLIREWVLSGHAGTLARLGVVIKRQLYQSDTLDMAHSLMRRGLEMGVLSRGDEGEVLYVSDREDFETMVLVRGDGFPTEYGRIIALIREIQRFAEEVDNYIAVIGDEWKPPGMLFEEISKKLGPRPLYDKLKLIYHGMVTLGGSKMKSSDGMAILIDDLLDDIIKDPVVQEIGDETHGTVTPEDAANILIKGFFLARHTRKKVEFSWENLLHSDHPGRIIARAWSRAHSPNNHGSTATVDEHRYNRLCILRAQELPKRIIQAVKDMEVRCVAKFLYDFSKLYLDAPRNELLDRMTSGVLEKGMRSLGMFA